MSITHISAELRRLVVACAEGLCEYCLIAEEDTVYGCAVDHIMREKHRGPTAADNLAYACAFCNQAKASDVGSLHWESGAFVRFFNPRVDRWADHFTLVGERIEPLTPIGTVTARILAFNTTERLLERQILQALSRYPSPEALKRIQA